MTVTFLLNVACWISHLGNAIYIILDLIEGYANIFSAPFRVVNTLVLTNVRHRILHARAWFRLRL